MKTLDPRINPYRPDLAARHLKGKVDAKRFDDGVVHEVVEAHTSVRRAPSHDAPLETEALMGERVTVYDTDGEGWCWGQLETDGYVGWLAENALGKIDLPRTHKVMALRTFGFPVADIKHRPFASLPMGARIDVIHEQAPFAVTSTGLFIPARHVGKMHDRESDFVAVAERFLDAPYLWGGKTDIGVDCSGLVQVSLQAAGIECPRDSDMQEKKLGKPIALSKLKRGDLVFWKGHVAIARDAKTLIHANAFHMAVAAEPVRAAVARIKAAGCEVTSVRRLSPPRSSPRKRGPSSASSSAA